MNSVRIHLIYFFIVLSFIDKPNIIKGDTDYQLRPKFQTENGNLKIESARNRNILIKMNGNGVLKINDVNLLQAINSAANGTRNDAQYRTLNSRVTMLTNRLNGRTGLTQRLSRLEQRVNAANRSGVYPVGPVQDISQLRQRIVVLETKVDDIMTKLTEDNCRSSPCMHGGTCIDGYDRFFCQCTPEWQGDTCNQDVNECSIFTGTHLGCQNGATCVNNAGGYSCLCPPNFIGTHCSLKTVDCATASSEICGHGYCVNRNTNIGYECICEPGWMKNVPASGAPACIIDINECETEKPHCSKDPPVSCRNIDGSYICGPCPQGFTGNGHYCVDINECETNNGGCSTSPTVACHNTRGSYYCDSCPVGFQGNGKICIRSSNSCDGFNMCHPLARCAEYSSGISCICPHGYTGNGYGPNGCTVAQIKPCDPNPCLNGGTCILNGNSSMCLCIAGTNQPYCERTTDLCSPNPCQNGGTCRTTERGRRRCTCASGFTGPLCQNQQTQCGQNFLNSPTGVLKYPPDGTSKYSSGDRCAWIIKTNLTHILNVTFTQFTLEQSTDCRYDWLQIHDGRSTQFPLIGRFCGNELPKGGNILSTHNMLYFWFRSDNSTEHDGFELKWESIVPSCGSTIATTTHGRIASPGNPGNYPINRDCYWYVTASPGKRIILTFYTVQIENHSDCDHDKLEIYSGILDSTEQTNGALLERFCNRSDPSPLTTLHNEVTIYFHSDGEGSDTGFQIHYAVVEGFPGCGGTFTSKRGEFGSPTIDGSYPNNVICEYLIRLPLESKINLKFLEFDIESHGSCRLDTISIYDGPDEQSPLINHYCGNTIPPDVKSRTNSLFIKFKTDWSIQMGGFRMKYEQACGGSYQESTGIISSPNYPGNYEHSSTCDFYIEAPILKAIVLTFTDFDLETTSDRNCEYDYIEIFDGVQSNSSRIGKYCGHLVPPVIVSTSNFLHIVFVTDISVGGRGFKGNYSFVDSACGGIYRSSEGTIRSPSDSELGGYLHSAYCRWIIYAPVGKVIQLQFVSFELEQSSDCEYDYVQIFDNSTHHGGSIGKYCGSSGPPSLTSGENIVTIIFKTDSTRNSVGFVATYMFLDASKMCGGNYFSSFGYIRSPGWPDNYLASKICEWTISVPVGQQIILYPKTFDLEPNEECRFDYLEIRNGGSSKSPLIGKFCGQNMTNALKSLSNKMYLKFVSDMSRELRGFEIEYDGTATGCGGLLTSPRGEFSSPNYPEPYGGNTICTWKVVVSRGSAIEVIITELDLEDVSGCYYDYIEVFDGPDEFSPKMGRYCSPNNHPLQILSTTNNLFIRMKTDSSDHGAGFNMRYRTICDITLNQPYGVIESPNYPGSYPTLIDCNWKIETSLGNKIFLEFSHFDLEDSDFETGEDCRYDYVTLVETEDGTKIQNLKYCGDLPNNFTSKNQIVEIGFHTDMSGSGSGFRLEYQTIGCGGVLTKPIGTFNSPNYPAAYPKNTHCNWTITADYGHSVELIIHDFEMEAMRDCIFDGLIIANYGNGSDYITKLCHTTTNATTITGSGHQMFVSFYSDVSSTFKGFNASYRFVQSSYGGKLTAPYGFIMSPNYPKPYENSMEAEWLIEIAENHLIEFHLMDFNLEDSIDCRHDKLMIYDGGDRVESKRLLTHCGDAMPEIKKYISSTNKLLIVLETDSSVTAKGFKMNYTTACGAILHVNGSGIISLGDFAYLQSSNCTWYLKASDPSKRITFNLERHSGFLFDSTMFDSEEEEKCPRALEIYDGDTMESPRRIQFCGERDKIPVIQSTGQYLTVSILTLWKYLDLTGVQFTGTYSIYDTACGADIHSFHGAIASPNYPNSYPLNAECVWKIFASPGNTLGISIRNLDIVKTDELCNENYLEIRETNEFGRLIDVFCGTNSDSNLTSSAGYYIKFRTGNVAVAKGFQLEYSYNEHNEIDGDRGSITSPLYPHRFRDFSYVFSWRITVEFGAVISLKIQDFYTDTNDYCINELKIFDGYDNNTRTLTEEDFCGYQVPQTMISSSNIVYIVFRQVRSLLGTKFNIQWEKIEKQKNQIDENDIDFEKKCGGNQTTIIGNMTEINITSPGYPNGYASQLNCTWIFTTNLTGFHPVIYFTDIDLEETESCYADYIQVSNSTNKIDWIDNPKLCAKFDNPIHAYHGYPFIKLRFYTNYNFNETGFKGNVRLDCGSELTGPNGVININKINFRYRVNKDACMWKISVRPGKRIKFTFDKMSINNSTGCTRSAIIFKNGIDETSPPLGIGKYCGNTIPEIPETFSNHAFIKFNHNYISTSEFLLRYEEIGQNCESSYILTPNNNFTIIATPPGLNPFMECSWSISVPSGEYLKLEYLEFNLKRDDNCEQEYLEIRTGSTAFAPVFNRDCGNKLPSPKIIKNNAIRLNYVTTIDDPNPGFKVKVSIFGCGSIHESPFGVISSPNYPTHDGYPSNLDCEYHIIGKAGSHLNITFEAIDLPDDESNCTSDFVEIFAVLNYDESCNCTNNRSLGKFCGTDTPSSINSFSNTVMIKFKTFGNRGVQEKLYGWSLKYNSSMEVCGGEINAESGTILSPGYPKAAQSQVTCVWKIKVPKGRKVSLKAVDLDLSTSIWDQYVSIYNDERYTSRIGMLRGSNYTNLSNSSDNIMFVRYISRTRTNNRGFKLTFTSNEETICAGDLNGPEGSFTNLVGYRSYMCQYERSTPLFAGEENFGSISFTVNNFLGRARTSPSQCDDIHSGLLFFYEASKQFKRICTNITDDTAITMPFSSAGLSVKQTYVYKMSFNLNYKLHRCGGILNGDYGDEINQLPFAENYGKLDCTWLIKYDRTQVIEFNLTSLDLKLPCHEEYIVVYQGETIEHPKISRFCGHLTKSSYIVSRRNVLFIEYHSKNYNKDSKFQIKLKPSTTACGGILNHHAKYFYSPYYDHRETNLTTYMDNAECIWEINADPGFHIGLEFIGRFNIEDSVNCTKDYIEVYDFVQDDWKLIGQRLCGRNLPSITNSTGTKMKVIFRSDGDKSGDGFTARWHDNCGGIFYANDKIQYMTSPKYPEFYPNKTYCNYTIVAPEGETIDIKFLDFELESGRNCQYDNLTVYKEREYFMPKEYQLTGTYCGTNGPTSLLIKDKAVLALSVDNYVEKKGFQFTYTLQACGEVITEPKRISSPFISNTELHPNSLNCYWNITAPHGKKIIIDMEILELEHNPQCYFDFVEIFSGNEPNAEKRIAKICGNHSAFAVNIPTSDALIYFRTDSSNNFRGFAATVRFADLCEFNYNLTTNSPRFVLDKTSTAYQNIYDCHYVIKSPVGTTINIHFEQFHIAPCDAARNKTNCSCDFVEIRDGFSTFHDLIGRYCGHTAPNDITTSGTTAWLRFATDGSLQSTGFKVTFEMKQSICGPVIYNITENEHKMISSPGNPIYLPNLRCSWAISVPPGRSIELEFESFELQEVGDYETCSNDVLEIVEKSKLGIVSEGLGETMIFSGKESHRDVSFWSGLRSPISHIQYCGSSKPPHFISQESEIVMNFVTDSLIQKSGFRIRASTVNGCSRNYTGVQGRIKKEGFENCNFWINAPENQTISLFFMQLYFMETDCTKAYIKIYENSEQGKLLATHCGYVLPNPIFTNVSSVFIKTQKPTEAQMYGITTNYDLYYVASKDSPGCGGELYNYAGIFSSPYFPMNHRNYSDCRWTVRVPTNNKIALRFSEFDMGSKLTCDTNFVQIIEIEPSGEENVARTYCGDDNPEVYRSLRSELVVRFKKTVNFEGTGFRAEFMGVKDDTTILNY